jgi:hypothetical protein
MADSSVVDPMKEMANPLPPNFSMKIRGPKSETKKVGAAKGTMAAPINGRQLRG